MTTVTATADVIHGDAAGILHTLAPLPHVFTSLPDAAEVGGDIDRWWPRFIGWATMCVRHTDPNGYAIFYQTDRRADGRLHDKAAMIVEAAGQAGARVIWHKIAVHSFGTSLYRPAFSHLIAVSRSGRAGRPTPDVWAAGEKVYPDAIDSASLRMGLDFLIARGATSLVDPFCGMGSIPVGALERGLSSVSIDIDPAMVAETRRWIARNVEDRS